MLLAFNHKTLISLQQILGFRKSCFSMHCVCCGNKQNVAPSRTGFKQNPAMLYGAQCFLVVGHITGGFLVGGVRFELLSAI